MSYVTGGLVLASATTSIVGASIGMSSSQGVWSLFNQFQLILMLPLLRSNVPQDLIVFADNLEFVTFNFAFVSKPTLDQLQRIKNTFDYAQPDAVYYDNSMQSGSFVVNQFGFIETVVATMLMHLC